MTGVLRAAWLYAACRVGLGAALVVAPTALRSWIGPVARRPGAQVLIRAFGARDAAIGAGTLLALREGAPVRGWLQAAALADAADAVSSLVAGRHLGPRRARLAALAATAGAVTGGWLAARLP